MRNFVDEVWTLADDVLFPRAHAVETQGILDKSTISTLSLLGLFGINIPAEAGGLGATPTQVREIHEALASGCGSTYFAWMQHQTLARKLATTENLPLRDRWLSLLATGEVIAGDINYLRREPPAIVATRIRGGYTLSGAAPWIASWGLAKVWSVAAIDLAARRVMYFLVNGKTKGLVGVRPIQTLAMGGAGCWEVKLSEVSVVDGDLIEELDWDAWRERDCRRTAEAAPALFGLLSRTLKLLRTSSSRAGNEVAEGVAHQLAGELCRYRLASYNLEDSPELNEDVRIEQQLEWRALTQVLAMRSCSALVSSIGGAAVANGHPAQRLLREAAFHSIQAQSQAVRTASLRAYL